MPSPAEHPPQLLWLVLPMAAVALWVTFSFVASCMGWRKFARRYPATSRPPTKAHEVPMAEFGFLAGYRCSVNVVFAEQGVYFYRMFPLTLFHRPFLLPWESVRCVEKKNGLVVGQHFLVEVKDAAGTIHLWLPGKVDPDLMRYYLPAREPLPPSDPPFQGQQW